MKTLVQERKVWEEVMKTLVRERRSERVSFTGFDNGLLYDIFCFLLLAQR